MTADSEWAPFDESSKNPWTTRHAAHLFRRAGFGGSIEEINSACESGLTATVDRLFNFSVAESFDTEMEKSGRLLSGGQDSKNLSAWWLLRMAQTPCPLQEKLTLFWHGHFATGAEKVSNARAMLRQNQLLREHAAGNFSDLVANVSRDVAMLIYLDSTDNRKTRPNENYARELMELFCLGPGHYSEQDIKEIARCFTGWQVLRKTFKFNSYQHDRGTKSFLGESGQFNGDDAIRIVLSQPASARFIARKLIRFFVFDDAPISDELAEPIAETLRNNDFAIRPALEQIFYSKLFYSERAIGQKIKSPVELAIGTIRFWGASTNMQSLADRLKQLGQLPLYPPNVKGWDGGRTWINASTVLARANLVERILRSDSTEFKSGSLQDWTKKFTEAGDEHSVDWIEDYLLATPLSQETRMLLDERIHQEPAATYAALAALPEYQLN